jgi:hypothetical protein
MRIKGIDRERRYRKRRFGMRVDGAAVRRVQLALLQRRGPARPASPEGTPAVHAAA